MVPDRHFEGNDEHRRYERLLEMADLVVRSHGLPELLPELAQRLHQLASFEVANFSIYDPSRNLMRMHFWEGKQLLPDLAELPMHESACGLALQGQQPVVWHDVTQETRFEPTIKLLKEKGVRSYLTVPLTKAERRLGTLGLGSSRVGAYTDGDVRLISQVAELVAVVLENSMTRAAFRQEKERLEVLLHISTALAATLDVQAIFPEVSGLIRSMCRHDYASVLIYHAPSHELRRFALDSPVNHALLMAGATASLESPPGRVFLQKESKVYSREELVTLGPSFLEELMDHGIKSVCCLPLTTRKGVIGTLNFASAEEKAFAQEDLNFLKQVTVQVANALDNTRAYREIADLNQLLKTEKLYLQNEIGTELNFEEIIGESPALRKVLAQVSTVAPSDATVLIEGETGTGKELVARALHRMSSRRDAGFIKLNCAAIPTGLMESELFGHEKGAFTGAVAQKIGRLELADRGTLFLDEVGDIPLELQPKLLRVLQDQEFERLGGIRTIKVNIRLIAATNRDLAKIVDTKEFRSDLYYRLHVFPVRMPALRERKGDVPLLVRYFVQRLARRMNKQIDQISTEAMDVLTRWHWPGNVRELENFLERCVILSDGATLNVPTSELRYPESGSLHAVTLERVERDHILRVLRETGGVIAGVRGAAARLGMKRTTLQSRMQKMGITRGEFQN